MVVRQKSRDYFWYSPRLKRLLDHVSADAVICQAGCVSHTAYYRLKESCKKLGKPCVFLKSPGMGSFARGLAALSGDAANVGSAIRLVD